VRRACRTTCHGSPAAEELLVDEVGDAGFLGARPELIRRDQARDRGVEESHFGRAEKHVLVGLGVLVRFGGRRGGRNAGGAERADRFQEATAA
jgi:hypothetical protein